MTNFLIFFQEIIKRKITDLVHPVGESKLVSHLCEVKAEGQAISEIYPFKVSFIRF